MAQELFVLQLAGISRCSGANRVLVHPLFQVDSGQSGRVSESATVEPPQRSLCRRTSRTCSTRNQVSWLVAGLLPSTALCALIR
ncbi:hypothetical protein BJX68DRAFT_239449 [Aspergillus pseudodeflectus]|uniref:Uncharacterized protein n=1 Tax=Aspergillus pseudodeflectus TaxID=176178 RepID=A0ABR4K5P4_9EURO